MHVVNSQHYLMQDLRNLALIKSFSSSQVIIHLLEKIATFQVLHDNVVL